MTVIISAFPGTGKTIATAHSGYKCSDSDSSHFSKSENFPANYIAHIREQMETHDIVFVSTHKEVREALIREGLEFFLVCPRVLCKEEYLQRYADRGSPAAFVELMEKNWYVFLSSCLEQKGCRIIILDQGQYVFPDVTNRLLRRLGEAMTDENKETDSVLTQQDLSSLRSQVATNGIPGDAVLAAHIPEEVKPGASLLSGSKVDEMLYELLNEIDYDIAKNYDVETAEEPDDVEENMNVLRDIVKKHVKEML